MNQDPSADTNDALSAGRERMLGLAYMAGALLTVGFLDTTAKYLTQDYHVVQVLWGRYSFHALLMIVVLAPARRLSLRTAKLKLQIIRSAILLLATYLFFSGLHYLPLTDATTISFLAPLFVTALSVPLLGERVGLHRWGAVLVGLVGVLIVMRPGLGVVHPAAFFVVGTAMCFALFQIATRSLGMGENPTTTLFYTALVGAVAVNILAPAYWRPPDQLGWALLIAAGFLGGLSHFFFIRAYRLLTASFAAPFYYFEIVWVTILGFAVFGDLPDAWTIVGAMIIIGSGLYVFHRERIVSRGPV